MAQQVDTALPVIDQNTMAKNRENSLLQEWYKLNLKEARDLQQARDNHLLEKSRREKTLRNQDNEYGPSDIDDLGREIIAAARKKEEEDLAEELVTELGNELFWVRKGYVEPKKEIIQKLNAYLHEHAASYGLGIICSASENASTTRPLVSDAPSRQYLLDRAAIQTRIDGLSTDNDKNTAKIAELERENEKYSYFYNQYRSFEEANDILIAKDKQLQEQVYDLEQELFKVREDIQMKDTRIDQLKEDAQENEKEIATQDKRIQRLKRKESLKSQLSQRDFLSLAKHGQDNAYRNVVQLYTDAMQRIEMLENKTHDWDEYKMTLDRSLKATAEDLSNANKQIPKLKQELCIKEPLVRAAHDLHLAWREVIKRLVGLPYNNALIIKANRIRHGGKYEAHAALLALGIYCTPEHCKWLEDTYGIVRELIPKDILDLVNMRGTVKACGFGTDQSLCSDEDEKTFNEHFDNAIDHYQKIKNMKLSQSESRKMWHDNTVVAKGMQKMKEIEEKVSRLERRRNPNVTNY